MRTQEGRFKINCIVDTRGGKQDHIDSSGHELPMGSIQQTPHARNLIDESARESDRQRNVCAFPWRDDPNSAQFVTGFRPHPQFITNVGILYEASCSLHELLHPDFREILFPVHVNEERTLDSLKESKT